MAWVPTLRVEVVIVARPLELSGALPRRAVPSKKLAVPVRELLDGLTVTTFAVRVTVWPGVVGFALDEIMTAVGLPVPVAVTIWLSVALVEALKPGVAA